MPIEKLISKEYARKLQQTIQPDKATRSGEMESDPVTEGPETTHYSVADAEGNAVALTYSLNADFGANVVPDGTGIVLNKTMGDFDVWSGTAPSEPNLIEPKKRPLSSMSPTIIAKDGRPVWILGSPGGPTIITTNVQIALNLIDFKMNIAEAVSARRIYHGWKPDQTMVEQRATTKDSLTIYLKMGHMIRPMTWHFGPAMCIYIDWDQNILFGAADPRSADGAALGF